jgi:hypothetical protein
VQAEVNITTYECAMIMSRMPILIIFDIEIILIFEAIELKLHVASELCYVVDHFEVFILMKN